MKGCRITLTWHEVFLAGTGGLMRQTAALKRQLPDRHGYDGDGWSVHIEGRAGEMAVAKHLGVYDLATVNTFRNGADVGRTIQVRTRSRPEYELIVRDNDRDDDLFVLVTGRCPEFVIVGYICGADAKREEWKKPHGGREAAYFVPHGALKPLPPNSIESLLLPSQFPQ